MALIPIPSNWVNPRFEFGDRVDVVFPPTEERVRCTVIGMRYVHSGYDFHEWIYDTLDEEGRILDPATEDWLYLV